jgi:hypothetical protein
MVDLRSTRGDEVLPLGRFGVLLFPPHPRPGYLPIVTPRPSTPPDLAAILTLKRSAPGGRAGPEQHPVLIRPRQDVIHDPVAAPGHPEPFPVVAQWPDPHRDRAPLPGQITDACGSSPRSVPAIPVGRSIPREPTITTSSAVWSPGIRSLCRESPPRPTPAISLPGWPRHGTLVPSIVDADTSPVQLARPIERFHHVLEHPP